MLYEQVISYKRILAELDFNGNTIFQKVGLIVTENRCLSGIFDFFLLFLRRHCDGFAD